MINIGIKMPKNQEKIKIEATLKRIIFQGNDNFIIGSFWGENGRYSALGNILNPQIDVVYHLIGNWEETPKYGPQFKFSSFQTIEPVTENGIFNYIVRVCKFVGVKTGNIILNEFGTDTLEIMRTNPTLMAKTISGITIDRAKTIQEVLLENQDQEKLLVDLESLLDVPGLPKNLIHKLIDRYKSNASEVVKTDPYVLMSFRGVSFLLADKVAMQNGIKPGSIKRKRAVAIHCLRENMKDGHTWAEGQDLLSKMKQLVPVKGLKDGLNQLKSEEIVMCRYGVFKETYDYWAFVHVDRAETVIAERVHSLLFNN